MAADIRKIDLTPKVNKTAEELLEEALRNVRSGETIGIAIVEVGRTGTPQSAWSDCSNYHALNSGVWRMAIQLSSVEPD